MRLSKLFTKTLREAPKDEESVNARLLVQAGYVQKLMAGVYTFLPLGKIVLHKIETIVREEMNKSGGVEILMPALHPKEIWERTKRWDSFDALFKLKSKSGQDYAIGPTHEEVLYPLLTHFVSSYKDLPISIYQIQTKFRDESRAKSGLLRGREFRMKDLYSFHVSDDDRNRYYNEMRAAYGVIFQRLGLNAISTEASGGTFSELSMEFQVPCEAGEDTIFFCKKCNSAVNEDIAGKNSRCKKCGGPTETIKSIEIGNIFPLKDTYAKDFHLTFKDASGADQLVSAGCYGLGTSRVLGTLAEVHNDEKGLLWPEAVAPFSIHLISLGEGTKTEAERMYETLQKNNVAVLYDDREDTTAGEKFADADLLGIPRRVVVSEKTLAKKSVEIKERKNDSLALVSIDEFIAHPC